jgi:RimJ/RimL family protein N-acetyltransferase
MIRRALADLQIRRLRLSDANALGRLVTDDPAPYRCYFEPFPGGLADVEAALERAHKDGYWGVFVGDDLAALVMLRGLDAGFAAPAFGVYVAERHAGQGLATAALAFAEAWCRLNNYAEVMLTVHAEHERARRLYEAQAFVASGERSAIGHLVYRKRLQPGARALTGAESG